jgi:hypothetical protein
MVILKFGDPKFGKPSSAHPQVPTNPTTITRRNIMAETTQAYDFNDPIRNLGPDATATFDNSSSNPTEHASSESLKVGTTLDGDTEDLENGDGINNDSLDLEDTHTAVSNLDGTGSTRIVADDDVDDDEDDDDDDDENDIDGNTADDDDDDDDDDEEDEEDQDEDEDEEDEDEDEVEPVKV